MLLSTVMTCHAYTKDYETEPNFLSDDRVLNTALTRARSLAMVFGDADCLLDCKIGSTWRKYIEACLEAGAGSLLGQTVSSRKVGQLLAKRSQFNVDAPVFLPGHEKIEVVDRAGEEDNSRDTDVEDSDESIVDCPSSDDEMAKIFHRDVVKPYIRDEVLPPVQQTKAVKKVIVQDVAEDGDDVKLKSVRVKSEAVTPLDFYEKEEFSRGTIFRYTPHLNLHEMEEVCRKHPEKYRKCFLDVRPNDDEAYGICMNDEEENILIDGRLRRNRAFDREPVLVEVLSTDDEDDCERRCPSGRVVGIYHKQRRERFVCKVQRNNSNLLVPLDQSQPLFWNGKKKSKTKASVSLFTVQRHGKREIKPASSIPLPKVPNRLFVVEFVAWSRKFNLPLGLPVADISIGTNFESGRKVLEIKHAVDDIISNPKFESDDPYQDVPDPSVFTRFSGCPVFTICSGKSRVIENAFGLKQKETGGWTACVYVVDVAAKVREGGEIDQRAQALATTVLDHEDNVDVWMLPERISTVICSLQPGQRKQVIAGYFDFDASGKETGVPRFEETRIQPWCKLTYDNVQDIILGYDPSLSCLDQNRDKLEQVYSDVKTLFRLSMKLRTSRLHGRCFAADLNWEHPDAHILEEELLLKMNCGIAEKLLEKSQSNTILRCQANVQKCKALLRDYYPLACLTGSVDLSDVDVPGEANACETLSLPKEFLQRIFSLVLNDEFLSARDSMESLKFMLRCEDCIPQLAVFLSTCRKNLRDLIYICSESNDRFPTKRFDLGAIYAPFTSPVSNYVDLTLQRVIKSKAKLPLRPNFSELCSHSNYRRRNAENFKSDLKLLSFSERLSQYPSTFTCVVESIQQSHLVLFFPTCPHILFQNRCLKLSTLEAVKLCFLDSESNCSSFVITWIIERLKDPGTFNCKEVAQVPLPAVDEFESVKGALWKRLVNDAIALDSRDTKEKVRDVVKEIRQCQLTNSRVVQDAVAGSDTQFGGLLLDGKDRASDDSDSGSDEDVRDAPSYDSDDNASFDCTISKFDLLSVQLSARVFEGLLQPFIQLVNFKNGLSVCVEHNERPEQCFSPSLPPGSLSVRNTFGDLTDYVDYWIRILQLELATTTIRGSAIVPPCLIDNLKINWSRGTDGYWIGRAKLDLAFVKENSIAYEELSYACVRYFNVTTTESGRKQPNNDVLSSTLQEKYSEVFHCVVSKSDIENDCLVIELTCYDSGAGRTSLFKDLKEHDRPPVVQMIHSSLPVK